jgi:hypothetical protein
MLAIPAVKGWRQEDCKFSELEGSFGYMGRSYLTKKKKEK